MASSLTVSADVFASTRFDYLIAGGGTAGLVVANRLSEIPTVQVGVIEAGEDLTDDPKIYTPLWMFDLQQNPKYDWNFSSEPQEALDGLKVAQARGKMLGGSSGINFMQFTFASRQDFDDWETLGNEGWNYEGIAPYYKKFENFQPPNPSIQEVTVNTEVQNAAVHGAGGPINASISPFYSPLQQAWLPTLSKLGLAAKSDPRDFVSIGAYNNPMVLTQGSSHRSFAGNSYWKPFATRPNLHTVTKAVVRNIIFEPSSGPGDLVATGLNFTVDGKSYIANAAREVVLSGGTMKSPQMLELSGVGNPEILSKYGIETKVNNSNVGENLQDHPQAGLPLVPNEGELTFDEIYNETLAEKWTKIFNENGTGLLAGGVADTAQLSWFQILGADKQGKPKELVDKYYNGTPDAKPGLKLQLDLTAKKLLDPKQGAVQTSGSAGSGRRPDPKEGGSTLGKSAFIGGFVSHAFSRGWIHIASDNPDDDPKFDPRYLSHPLDFEVLKDLVLFGLNISQTAPMSEHLQGNGTVFVPPLKEVTDDTVRDLINVGFGTGWHIVGSCAMMPRDQGGVVDNKLKVYGTKNVRVIDASIVPLHVKGNTVSLTYAIAEKGADLVKEGINGTTGTGATPGGQAFAGAAAEGMVVSRLLVILLASMVFFGCW